MHTASRRERLLLKPRLSELFYVISTSLSEINVLCLNSPGNFSNFDLATDHYICRGD